jgi:hypothetical protein
MESVDFTLAYCCRALDRGRNSNGGHPGWLRRVAASARCRSSDYRAHDVRWRCVIRHHSMDHERFIEARFDDVKIPRRREK